MSQQLEEQQDFGSQAVQGHEQKQERKGDTDAKEGGGTPPQAPPGPAPGIKKADAAAEALENFYEADDEDVAAESKKVVMALRALRPRASNYAKLKVSIEYKYQTHDVWAAIMQDIMDYEADLPPEWAALFRNDGGLGASRGTTQSTVKQQQPVQRNTQFMSVKTAPVMITKYNGKRGEARRWWKNARSILCDFTPNPTENDKLKWLAIIKQAMDLYETGRTRIRQLEKIHTTVSGLRDVEAIMKAFVNEQDANSLPQAIRKYRAMMQHEREPVRDFATRFQDMIDELHDFNYNTGDDQARFEEFKLKIKESTYVTEKGYTTMEAAVQAISLREQEQDRKFTSPKVPGIGNINAIKPQRDWYKDREGNRRCGYCSRKGKHTAKDCRDRKEGRPRMTIRQLNEHYEKLKRKKGRGQGYNNSKWQGSNNGKNNKYKNKKQNSINAIQQQINGILDHLKQAPTKTAVPATQDQDKPMTLDDIKNLGVCNINDEDANRTIKVAMTKVKVKDSYGDYKKLPALWDSGSMPKSFISLSTEKTHITALLYHYYWPYKLKEIRTYLRGCRCSSLKAAGVATKESSKSRASKKIKARNFLDIVQIDVYKYDGYHYLTFVDVATGKCWVKKIIKVNVAKKNKGLYKQRLTNCYRTWESELQAIPDEVSINKIPKKLHVDNETSLLQLPHPNIDASPVYYAQSNSKVERLHRTLANLSRINSTTPDKIQGLVNDTFTSGGGIKDKEREEGDDNDDDTESEDEKVPYDGRVLKEGQYVRAKVNLRSRNKQDPFWGGVAKVTERKGRKQYYIYDGNRVTLRHISHLKNYDIGEKLLEDVKVNPTVWERAMPCLGPRPKFDVEYGNNKVRVNDDWRMKIVYLGYPGLRNMERVAMKIKDGKYQLLYLAVPDLPFEHWYKVLGDLDAEGWYGHEPKDEGEFWVSDKGDKVREESITWWLVKFRKR
eukprot:jgi/Bigna1/89981/estExt_fgenesh1_pg.C_590092